MSSISFLLVVISFGAVDHGLGLPVALNVDRNPHDHESANIHVNEVNPVVNVIQQHGNSHEDGTNLQSEVIDRNDTEKLNFVQPDVKIVIEKRGQSVDEHVRFSNDTDENLMNSTNDIYLNENGKDTYNSEKGEEIFSVHGNNSAIHLPDNIGENVDHGGQHVLPEGRLVVPGIDGHMEMPDGEEKHEHYENEQLSHGLENFTDSKNIYGNSNENEGELQAPEIQEPNFEHGSEITEWPENHYHQEFTESVRNLPDMSGEGERFFPNGNQGNQIERPDEQNENGHEGQNGFQTTESIRQLPDNEEKELFKKESKNKKGETSEIATQSQEQPEVEKGVATEQYRHIGEITEERGPIIPKGEGNVVTSETVRQLPHVTEGEVIPSFDRPSPAFRTTRRKIEPVPTEGHRHLPHDGPNIFRTTTKKWESEVTEGEHLLPHDGEQLFTTTTKRVENEVTEGEHVLQPEGVLTLKPTPKKIESEVTERAHFSSHGRSTEIPETEITEREPLLPPDEHENIRTTTGKYKAQFTEEKALPQKGYFISDSTTEKQKSQVTEGTPFVHPDRIEAYRTTTEDTEIEVTEEILPQHEGSYGATTTIKKSEITENGYRTEGLGFSTGKGVTELEHRESSQNIYDNHSKIDLKSRTTINKITTEPNFSSVKMEISSSTAAPSNGKSISNEHVSSKKKILPSLMPTMAYSSHESTTSNIISSSAFHVNSNPTTSALTASQTPALMESFPTTFIFPSTAFELLSSLSFSTKKSASQQISIQSESTFMSEPPDKHLNHMTPDATVMISPSSSMLYLNPVSSEINILASSANLEQSFDTKPSLQVNTAVYQPTSSFKAFEMSSSSELFQTTTKSSPIQNGEYLTPSKKSKNSGTVKPEKTTIKTIQVPKSKDTSKSVYINIDMNMTLNLFCKLKHHFVSQLANIPLNAEKSRVTEKQIMLQYPVQDDCEKLTEPWSDGEKEEVIIQMYVLDMTEKLDIRLTLDMAKNIIPVFEKTKSEFSQKIINVQIVMKPEINNPHTETPRGQSTKTEEIETGITIAVIIAAVGGFSCVSLIILQCIIHKRSGKRLHPYFSGNSSSRLSVRSMDSIALGVVPKSRPHSGFWNLGLELTEEELKEPSHPLNYAALTDFSMDTDAIYQEFQLIPNETPRLSCVPVGAEDKNRFANVIPYPHTRVKLLKKEGEEVSDYINANYVTGYKDDLRAYIATQAPMSNTAADFWRMVWEQQSRVILMLTEMDERGQPRCTQYWPDKTGIENRLNYGDYSVVLKKKEIHQEYIVSILEIKDIEKNLVREIRHFWYTCWPLDGTPEPISLVKFVLDTRPYYEDSGAPVVVHCSPGTGRTGCFIALDICMRSYEDKRTVNILNTVYKMRKQRAGAVHTKDQYNLVYKAVNEYTIVMNTPTSISTTSSIVTLQNML